MGGRGEPKLPPGVAGTPPTETGGRGPVGMAGRGAPEPIRLGLAGFGAADGAGACGLGAALFLAGLAAAFLAGRLALAADFFLAAGAFFFLAVRRFAGAFFLAGRFFAAFFEVFFAAFLAVLRAPVFFRAADLFTVFFLAAFFAVLRFAVLRAALVRFLAALRTVFLLPARFFLPVLVAMDSLPLLNSRGTWLACLESQHAM
jgi:hypothetical protein